MSQRDEARKTMVKEDGHNLQHVGSECRRVLLLTEVPRESTIGGSRL